MKKHWQIKIKKLESGYFSLRKCCCRWSTKEAISQLLLKSTVSFQDDFFTFSLGEWWKIKTKKQSPGFFLLWKCYVQGAPRKNLCHCFFDGARRIFRLARVICTSNLGKQWQIDLNKLQSGHFTLCNCYTQGYSKKEAISSLLWPNTQNFQNKWLLHMQPG